MQDSVQTDSTELLRTLIRNACVNDGDVASGPEVRNVDALEAYFAGSGLSCERYSPAPGRANLITRIEGSDRTAPTLILMGHTDVVPVNASGWSRDPLGAEVEDGIVWGRGAIDMLNITATMAVGAPGAAGRGGAPHTGVRDRRSRLPAAWWTPALDRHRAVLAVLDLPTEAGDRAPPFRDSRDAIPLAGA
jgi:acetylornithine deacetylase/succinyl-diaminopimelate desuccinylase-like protein